MSFTFLSLPREIRDQIYYETLCTDNVTRIGARAEKSYDTWIAGREHLPGYYRPLLHFHKVGHPRPVDNGRGFDWQHETRIASAPPLFQVGGTIATEARELYLKTHVLFEMKIMEDCETSLARWVNCLDEKDKSVMQKLHVYVHVRLQFEGPEDDPLTKRLQDASDYTLDLVDPVFRIELQNGGDNLAVLSTGRFESDVKDSIITSMRQHFKSRSSGNPNDVFTGADLLLAMQAVLNAVGIHRDCAIYLMTKVDVKDVACVYDYEDRVDAKHFGYGTVVRLRDRWSNIVVKSNRLSSSDALEWT